MVRKSSLKRHETLEPKKAKKIHLSKIKSPPTCIMLIITQKLFVIISIYCFFSFQQNIVSSNEKEGVIDQKNWQLSISSKMSLKRPESSLPSSTEIKEFILPEEIWIMIWKYLDFKTLQKVCTQVSKSWLEMIRGSKLSWEMKLRTRFIKPDFTIASPLQVKDFEAMLLHWKELRVIHFSSQDDFDKFRSSLNSHNIIGKVVISPPRRRKNRQKFLAFVAQQLS